MDDTDLMDCNVQSRADAFVAQMKTRASVSRTDQIMVLFGDDFQYENANVMFKV